MARQSKRAGESTGVVTALIYTRVSSDEQSREGLSLGAQLQACNEYAAQRGWILGSEYQDVLSGKRDEPAYQAVQAEARALASQGRSVAVVVMRLDRFGRRLLERVRCREEFKQIGVAIHSVKEGGEVSDLMSGFLAVLAQEEVERLGDRIRDTREHNERNGWHLPGRAPLGYCWRPSTEAERAAGAPKSALIVDEEMAPVVREAFRKLASGECSPRAVTLWLAGLPGMPRRIHNSAVAQMLRAPVYAGKFESGERGRWEPLIDDAVWSAAQTRMARVPRGPVSGNHLLTAVLRCPKCDGRMSGWTTGGTWKRYRCGSFAEGGDRAVRNCGVTVGAKKLDADVLRQARELLAPLADRSPKLLAALGKAWDALRKPDDGASREHARLLARARRDADDARRRLAEAARLLVDGTIDRTAYGALAAEEERRLTVAEGVLQAPASPTTGQELPPLADVLAELGGWQAALDGTVSTQRPILAALIGTVVPVWLRYGTYDAQIAWTPVGLALRALAQRSA